MPRPSVMLWFCCAMLLLCGVYSAFRGMATLAVGVHGTDALRDDVEAPLYALAAAGAVDFDKAARALNLPAYQGTTTDERTKFEDKVQEAIARAASDPAHQRVLRELSNSGGFALVAAIVSAMLAAFVGFQARRVAE